MILIRCDLTSSNLKKATLKNAYLRGADCRETKFNYAILDESDFCRAYLLNSDFTNAILSKVSLKGANLDGANFEGADFDNLIWDIGTQWFNAKGLHKVKKTPQKLKDDQDFQDAQKLSKGLEALKSGEISKAIKICKEVAQEVQYRRGDTSAAIIYNKFAWLACLFDNTHGYRNEIENIASQAVKLNPQSGSYKDTYAIALVLNSYTMHMPAVNTEAEDYDIEHPYEFPISLLQEALEKRANSYSFPKRLLREALAIKLLRKALDSEDFQKLALPNSEKIRQRRNDWIERLKRRQNPFTSEMLSMLLQEEY